MPKGSEIPGVERSPGKSGAKKTHESARRRVGSGLAGLATAAAGVVFGLHPILRDTFGATWSEGLKQAFDKTFDSESVMQGGGTLVSAATTTWIWHRGFKGKMPKTEDRISTYKLTGVGFSVGALLLLVGGALKWDGDDSGGRVATTSTSIGAAPPVNTTGNVTLPPTSTTIDLGEGSGCEIAPYILDNDDVQTPEDLYRKETSIYGLKQTLSQKIDPDTGAPYYTGTIDTIAGRDLTYAVDEVQIDAGIDTGFPWNLETCLATELGDGQPGPFVPVAGE